MLIPNLLTLLVRRVGIRPACSEQIGRNRASAVDIGLSIRNGNYSKKVLERQCAFRGFKVPARQRIPSGIITVRPLHWQAVRSIICHTKPEAIRLKSAIALPDLGN